MKIATFLLAFFLLFTIIASCATPADTPIPRVTLPVTLTHTAYPTIIALPTMTRQPSPTATKTPRPTDIQSATSEPVGQWQIPVVDLHWAENGFYRVISWMEDTLIVLEDTKHEMVALDAYTGNVLVVHTPTPEVTSDNEAWLKGPSATGEFEITCSETGLAMYHLPDRQLISKSNLQVSNCHQILWASDGTAASFVTERGEVYIWRNDGTAPFLVGRGMDATQAQWSPDNKRLLVVGNFDINLEATFNIAYPDGRPMKITRADIEVGNEWEPGSLTWFTNDIVRNRHGCVIPNYCVEDYYQVDSGKFLIRHMIDETGGQKAMLSPDQRWLVLDASPNAESWENRYTFNGEDQTRLVLYDLIAQKSHVWIKGELASPTRSNLSFEFIGWNPDSSQFYFTYYPFSNLSTSLPAGYTVLDRSSLKTQLLVPNVIFDRLSQDGKFLFVVTANQIEEHMVSGVQGAIFTLDGVPVTKWQILAEQYGFDELHLTVFYDFYNEGEPIHNYDLIPVLWNRDSSEIVFAIPGGELWLMSTSGEIRQLASDLPMENNWSEDVHLSWSPDGRFLIIQWGARGWIAQIHAQ